MEKYAIDELLQDFKLNLTLLNEIICTTTTILMPVTITHKQNNVNQSKWK